MRENGRKAVVGEEKGRKAGLVSRGGPLQSQKPKAKLASVAQPYIEMVLHSLYSSSEHLHKRFRGNLQSRSAPSARILKQSNKWR